MINKIKTTVLCLLLLLSASTVQARTLPQILQHALKDNPKLSEALANERIAGSRLEQTAASRWPVVAATGGQRVFSSKNKRGSGFSPALKGTWTIYDFGKNDAQIDSDLLKIDYFTYKTQETAEELIYEIAGYYLEALKAKMSLKIARDNLKRHHEIVRMLKIIVKYDPGRRSELTQARSRLLQVESDITNYQRALGLSLLRIAPYIKPAVTSKELSDPFVNLQPKTLVARYGASEKEIQSHPSYVAQEMELKRIAADLVLAEKAKLPKVDLVGVASPDESTVYLNLDVDLFNRKFSPGVDEKRHEIQSAQAQLEQIKRNLDERARLAKLKMFQDQTRLYIAKNQIKELKQVAMDYEDQFSIAKRTLLDVVNAYRELAGIELFRIETQYSLMVSKLDYLSAVGGLRDWASVESDEISRHPLLLETDVKSAKFTETRKDARTNTPTKSSRANLTRAKKTKAPVVRPKVNIDLESLEEGLDAITKQANKNKPTSTKRNVSKKSTPRKTTVLEQEDVPQVVIKEKPQVVIKEKPQVVIREKPHVVIKEKPRLKQNVQKEVFSGRRTMSDSTSVYVAPKAEMIKPDKPIHLESESLMDDESKKLLKQAQKAIQKQEKEKLQRKINKLSNRRSKPKAKPTAKIRPKPKPITIELESEKNTDNETKKIIRRARKAIQKDNKRRALRAPKIKKIALESADDAQLIDLESLNN